MATRKKLGLIFLYDEGWIGGTYYVLNIIHALNTLIDSQKPEITILSEKEKDFHYVKSETRYPSLRFIKLRRRRRIDSLIKIYRKLKYVYKPQIISSDFDMVFPNPADHYVIKNDDSKCYWIADFQEEHLPELFSDDDIVARKQNQIKIAVTAKKLILSSHDALKDYKRLYPFSKIDPLVLPFAVSNGNLSAINLELLQEKFKINKDFFFCANQFWFHKNHMVILEAVKKLKTDGVDIQVLFSGKDFDYRQPGLLDQLKTYARENDLLNHIKFLGFIDRNEMLNLMSYSAAVIQPSLFEGWSTVNEDAKSLGKYIIASDINIHKEQLRNNYSLFNAGESDSLVKTIKNFLKVPTDLIEIDYKENIRVFGEKFYDFI